MEDKVLVTVILTVYNRVNYLENALKSALNQTMTKFEIIIADDSGSRLAEPLYKLYERDKRVEYQPNTKTLGIVNSLKKAVQQSKGDFISILNDDDCWEETFLEELCIPLLINDDYVLSFSDHWIIDDKGNLDIKSTNLNTIMYKRNEMKAGKVEDPKRTVLINNGVPLAMASIFRKSTINFNLLVPDVAGSYDFWLSCLLAASNKYFYYNNKRLTRYRIHPTMETGRRSTDKQLNMIYIFKSLLDMNFFPEYNVYILNRYSFSLYKFGRDQFYFGAYSTARSYFKQAISIKLDYRPLLFLCFCYLPTSILKNINRMVV